MQRIFSSTKAHTGITLKTSEKAFQSFRLYFLLPKILLFFTLIIKSINSIDAGTLMVSPQQKKVLRVLDFICK